MRLNKHYTTKTKKLIIILQYTMRNKSYTINSTYMSSIQQSKCRLIIKSDHETFLYQTPATHSDSFDLLQPKFVIYDLC